jgi:2'-5' RNA ligase
MAASVRLRLFAGIELDEGVRNRCSAIQQRLIRAGLEAKYESTEKLHVTLAFLGNVERDRVESVERVLYEAALATPRLVLRLDRISAFPNERRPRIVWIGSRVQHPGFRMLSRKLRNAYQELGFTFENDTVAHVTLARIKGGGRHPVPMLDVDPIEVRVDEIALFESLQDETTTRYVVRRTAPLSDRSA